MIDRHLVLEGFGVRLEPLALHHLDALRAACHDERLWQYTFSPSPFGNVESAREWLDAALAEANCVPFAIVDAPTGDTIGSTRYFEIDAAHRKLEIGWTFLVPETWRTHVNSACKLLLLQYAFETWRAVRVQFKAEAVNARSRHALEHLGATHEGTLRNFRIRAGGEVRDTSYYSIIDADWPPIKARLLDSLKPPRSAMRG